MFPHQPVIQLSDFCSLSLFYHIIPISKHKRRQPVGLIQDNLLKVIRRLCAPEANNLSITKFYLLSTENKRNNLFGRRLIETC